MHVVNKLKSVDAISRAEGKYECLVQTENSTGNPQGIKANAIPAFNIKPGPDREREEKQ